MVDQPCGVPFKPLAVGNKISCVLFQCSCSRRNILWQCKYRVCHL